jgi:hypothetical protein
LTVRAAVALGGDIARAFSATLHKDDVEQELGKCRPLLATLVKRYLLPIAEQMALTAPEVEHVLAHRVGRLDS